MLFSPLYSGSSGNCTFIEAGAVRLLVDAGLTGSRIEQALNAVGAPADTITAMLVTHEHIDHVRGLGVLSRRHKIPIYANAACWDAMSSSIGEIPPACVRVIETGRDFYIKDVNITPFSIPHDAAEPVGYTFAQGGWKAGVLTDVGHVDERLIDAVSDCDILLLEANHDVDMLKAGPYPYALKQRILSHKGHLSNEDSGRALCRLFSRGLHNAVLGHLSAENNDEHVALATVQGALREEGILSNMRIALAHRDRPCGVFHLE